MRTRFIQGAILLVCCLLAGCALTGTHKSESGITVSEVVHHLNEHQVALVEAQNVQDSVFSERLNQEKPSMYQLEDALFSIYSFPTVDARLKAEKDFKKRVETMNVMTYETYMRHNVLIFYVHGLPIGEEIPYEQAIQKMINQLIIE